MVDVENNNAYTRNFYQWDALLNKGRVDPELFNNAVASDGYPGLQKALRDIIVGLSGVGVIYTPTHSCAPSGTPGSIYVDSGYIITRNGDGQTRIFSVAASGPFAIGGYGVCIAVENTGVCTVKSKSSLVDTDIVIAYTDDNLTTVFDARRFVNGNKAITTTVSELVVAEDALVYGGVTASGASTFQKDVQFNASIGVGTGFIILGTDVPLSIAVGVVPAGTTIVLPPGTYTGNVTITKSVTIMGTDRMTTIIAGNITISANVNFTLAGVNLNGYVSCGGSPTGRHVYRDCAMTALLHSGMDYYTSGGTLDLVIMDCTITADADAIVVSVARSIIMKRCKITSIGSQGVDANAITNLYVEDCEFTSTYNAFHTGTINAIFRGCKISLSSETTCVGISLGGTTGSLIVSDCSVTGLMSGGIQCAVIGGTTSIITGCYVYCENVTSAAPVGILGKNISNCVVIQKNSGKLTVGIENWGLVTGCTVTAATAIHANTGAKKHANFENGTFTHGDTT